MAGSGGSGAVLGGDGGLLQRLTRQVLASAPGSNVLTWVGPLALVGVWCQEVSWTGFSTVGRKSPDEMVIFMPSSVLLWVTLMPVIVAIFVLITIFYFGDCNDSDGGDAR